MDKKRHEPPAWKWEEGVVDKNEEHIKVGYGGFEEPFVPMALVTPGEGLCFSVQFLVKKGNIDPGKREIYDAMIKELNFFLVELREQKPWLYAIRHCGTASNMYSDIRWAIILKVGWINRNYLTKKSKNLRRKD